MTIADLVKYLSENPGVLAAVLSVAVAIIGCYFGLIEYYIRKAFYDYYLVPDFARADYRVQFDPDYALYGLGAVSFVVLMWFLMSPLYIIVRIFLLAFIGAIASGFLSKALYRSFLRGANDIMPGRNDADLRRDAATFGKWVAGVWLVCACVYGVVWLVLSEIARLPELITVALCVIACGIVIPLAFYNLAKGAVPLGGKTLLFIDPGDDFGLPGFTGYAILESNNGIHYCTQAKMVDAGKVVVDCGNAKTALIAGDHEIAALRCSVLVVEGIPAPFASIGKLLRASRNAAADGK